MLLVIIGINDLSLLTEQSPAKKLETPDTDPVDFTLPSAWGYARLPRDLVETPEPSGVICYHPLPETQGLA